MSVSSGTPLFPITRDQIIIGALRCVGAKSPGQAPTAEEIKYGQEALNLMLQGWQGKNIGLWANQPATLFTQPGQSQYKIGRDTTPTITFANTTLSSEAASGATSLPVVSSAGMTVGDNVGIVVDGGTNLVHWTTIATIASSTAITINDALPEIAEIGEAVYTFPAGTRSVADHCTTSFTSSTLTSGRTAGQSAVVAGATFLAGLTVGDTVGVVLDSGVIHWGYLVAKASSVDFIISNPFPATVTSGNKVFGYTRKIERPMQLKEARFRVHSTQTDSVLELQDLQAWAHEANKSTGGNPIKVYFDPQLNTVNLNVHPVPTATTSPLGVIEMTVRRPFDIFTAISENPDFPSEWLRAIKFSLAVELAPEYGVTQERATIIATLAGVAMADAMNQDSVLNSISFIPKQ